MKAECRTFRSRLISSLRGRADLTELSWHEHLLACRDCRDVLDAEEALEMLLESLPSPSLPTALAERVLARLEEVRPPTAAEQGALDRLLDLSTIEPAPADLARRVGVGIERKRASADAELDRLLDGQPDPRVPRSLASDLLARLEPHRERVAPSKPLRVHDSDSPPVRRPMRWLPPVAVAAAALVLVAFWRLWSSDERQPTEPPGIVRAPESSEREAPRRVSDDPEPGPPAPSGADPVDEELLASLDLLEDWELLTDDELDLLLSSLDPWDEALLEMEAEARELDATGEKNG